MPRRVASACVGIVSPASRYPGSAGLTNPEFHRGRAASVSCKRRQRGMSLSPPPAVVDCMLPGMPAPPDAEDTAHGRKAEEWVQTVFAPLRKSFTLVKKPSASGCVPGSQSFSKARNKSFCFFESLTGVSTATST